MDIAKIGEFLRDLRKEQNLTQEELAEKLGTTNKTISRWETGTYMPPVDALLQMSKLYDVSVNEILSGERLSTADYQPKAEENIVTTLKDTSVAKKRSKKTVIACVSVSCVLLILLSYALYAGSVLGVIYLLLGGRKVYTSGDFTYKTFGNKDGKWAEITGLSEQGLTKEVIIIPSTIDGLRVSSVEDRSLFGDNAHLHFKSDALKKVYFARANIFCDKNLFYYCTNLTQVILLNCLEEDDINEIFVGDDSPIDYYMMPTYMYKEIYELRRQDNPQWAEKNNWHAANVTYYYNYFGTPNGDCYWLDQVEAGQPITFIPPEPARENKKYKFDGWYTEKECINRWSFFTHVIPESGELDLYAKWTYNP